MINSSSLVFALALLVNSFIHSATSAPPASRIKDDTANQDSFGAAVDEDTGPGDFSPRRFPLVEGRLADEDGTKRIFILAVSIAAEGFAKYVRKTGFLKGCWMVKAVSVLKGFVFYWELK